MGDGYTQQINQSTGNIIASKQYDFSFDAPYEDINYLTTFIFNEFSTPNLATSGVNIHSMVTVEKVIENSSIVNNATVYTTQNGEIWTGPIHMHQGRPMEGSFHTNRPHSFLDAQRIFNFKTQDLRVFDRIDQLQIDISPNESQFKANYVSDLYLGRTIAGGSSFVFNFDHLDFLVNNSKFGKLLEKAPKDLRRQLLTLSPITTLTLTRERVRQIRGQNSILSSDLREHDFDTQDVPYVVVTSADQDGALVQSLRYSFGGENSQKYIQVNASEEQPNDLLLTGKIEQINVERVGERRTFAGIDQDVSRKTDGLYQYGLKIRVFDGVSTYVENKAKELESSIEAMTRYVDILQLPGNYDPLTNSFTQTFINNFGRGGANLVRPWMASIAIFVDIVGLVTSIGVQEKSSLSANLYSCLDPNVSTIAINTRFLNQMREMLQKLNSLIGKNRELHTRNKSSSYQVSSQFRTLAVETKFAEVFDATVPKTTSFNYLETSDNFQNEVLRIKAADLNNRVNMEIDRYSEELFTQDELNSNFDFLTGDEATALISDNPDFYIAPKNFFVGGTSIDLLSQNKDSLDFITTTAVIQNILYSPSSKGATTEPDKDTIETLGYVGKGSSKERLKGIKNLYVSAATNNNIFVNSLNIDFNLSLQDEATTSSEQYIGKNNGFSTDTKTIESSTTKTEKQEFADAISVIQSVIAINNISFDNAKKLTSTPLQDISFNLKSENNFINKKIRPTSKDSAASAERLASLPTQIKKLTLNRGNIYKGASADLVSNEDSKNDGFIYNFGMLRQIEYLNGYQNNFIKAPRWTHLTQQVLDSSREPLICRIRKINNPDVNIGSYEAMDNIPVNNEYFIVNPNISRPNIQTGAIDPRVVTSAPNELGYSVSSFAGSPSAEFLNELINLDNQRFLIQDQIEFTITNMPAAPTGLGGKITGLKKR